MEVGAEAGGLVPLEVGALAEAAVLQAWAEGVLACAQVAAANCWALHPTTPFQHVVHASVMRSSSRLQDGGSGSHWQAQVPVQPAERVDRSTHLAAEGLQPLAAAAWHLTGPLAPAHAQSCQASSRLCSGSHGLPTRPRYDKSAGLSQIHRTCTTAMCSSVRLGQGCTRCSAIARIWLFSTGPLDVWPSQATGRLVPVVLASAMLACSSEPISS